MNYWTSIFPFIVLMSIGMGAVFVPLTLTAVHHVRAEDSGIGSGVLNTMQQVGGALGLAILSTVAAAAPSTTSADELASAAAPAQGGRPARRSGRPASAYARLVHRRRHRRLPGRRGLILLGSAGHLALPRRQARGARHRRPARASRSTSADPRTHEH